MKNKELTPLEALGYLDDIAHKRKMAYDPHELKLIVEKGIKALEIIKEHLIDVGDFVNYEDYIDYFEEYGSPNCSLPCLQALTQYEFDLLKEVLQ